MTTYRIPEDIIVTELDNNEAILLDMRNKRYYSLNETGLLIFKGIEAHLPEDAIIDKVTSLYEVDSGKARDSVKTLINRLLSLNVIEQNET